MERCETSGLKPQASPVRGKGKIKGEFYSLSLWTPVTCSGEEEGKDGLGKIEPKHQ
jgi:hypothetical protein